MGVEEGEAAPEEEAKLEVPEKEAEQGEKTIGRQRTQTE